jgi:hypothetical protein
MSSAVTWNFNLSVVKGPSLSLPESTTVGAYDNISAAIPNSNVATNVQIASFKSGESVFIIITSDQYDQTAQSGGALTFTVWIDGAQVGSAFSLDGPMFLMSPLSTTMLIPSASLTSTTGNSVVFAFKNATSAPANVSILVGRTASP